MSNELERTGKILIYQNEKGDTQEFQFAIIFWRLFRHHSSHG